MRRNAWEFFWSGMLAEAFSRFVLEGDRPLRNVMRVGILYGTFRTSFLAARWGIRKIRGGPKAAAKRFAKYAAFRGDAVSVSEWSRQDGVFLRIGLRHALPRSWLDYRVGPDGILDCILQEGAVRSSMVLRLVSAGILDPKDWNAYNWKRVYETVRRYVS